MPQSFRQGQACCLTRHRRRRPIRSNDAAPRTRRRRKACRRPVNPALTKAAPESRPESRIVTRARASSAIRSARASGCSQDEVPAFRREFEKTDTAVGQLSGQYRLGTVNRIKKNVPIFLATITNYATGLSLFVIDWFCLGWTGFSLFGMACVKYWRCLSWHPK